MQIDELENQDTQNTQENIIDYKDLMIKKLENRIKELEKRLLVQVDIMKFRILYVMRKKQMSFSKSWIFCICNMLMKIILKAYLQKISLEHWKLNFRQLSNL